MIGEKNLFLAGCKKAILVNKVSEPKVFEELREKGYPYLEIGNENLPKETLKLFFQNKRQKNRFESEAYIDKSSKRVCKAALGIELGYPPIAVRDFVTPGGMKNKALVDYHGMCFLVKEENVLDAIDQLELYFNIPKNLAKEYHSNIFIRII